MLQTPFQIYKSEHLALLLRGLSELALRLVGLEGVTGVGVWGAAATPDAAAAVEVSGGMAVPSCRNTQPASSLS